MGIAVLRDIAAKNQIRIWGRFMRLSCMINNYKRCIRMALKEKGLACIALIFSLIAAAFSICSSITLKIVVDEAIPTQNVHYLWTLQFIFIVAVLISSLFEILEKRLSTRIALNAQVELRQGLFNKVMDSSYLDIQGMELSELITTMNYSVDQLEGLLSRCITVVVGDVVTIVAVLIIMVCFDLRLTLLSLVIYPVLVFVSSFINKRIDRVSGEVRINRATITRSIEEVIECYVSIENYSLKQQISDKFKNILNVYSEKCLHRDTLYEVLFKSSWSLVIVPYQAVLYGLGGTLAIIYGYPTIGVLLIFGNFTNYLIQPVMGLVNLARDLAVSITAFDSIDCIMSLEKKKEFSYKEPKNSDNFLEVVNLDYSYSSIEKSIIKNLNCDFKNGETIVLWGRSGSGKSTLLKLLGGLIEPIDGASVLKKSKDAWGYFPQEPQMLDGTIMDNFRYARADICEEDVWKILKDVDLERVIGGKDLGLNTPINRKDSFLSVGEYRRLCLAVFLVADFDVMLFDEPTASLDKLSVTSIVNVLKSLNGSKSIVIATHDIEVKQIADDIVDIGCAIK